MKTCLLCVAVFQAVVFAAFCGFVGYSLLGVWWAMCAGFSLGVAVEFVCAATIYLLLDTLKPVVYDGK